MVLAGTNGIGGSSRHALAFLFNINGQTEGDAWRSFLQAQQPG
jgi:hypothetical protein